LGEFVDGEVDAGAFVEELGGFLGHRRAAHRPVTPWGRLRSVRTGARPPAEVYDLVSNVPTMASRSDEVADAWWEQRVDEAAAVRVGERFTARNQNFGVSWETTSTVTAADPGRRFAYTVGDLADPSARWSFELSGPDEGPTEVLHTAELGPGPSMLTRVSPRHRDHAVCRRLAHLGEARRAPSPPSTPSPAARTASTTNHRPSSRWRAQSWAAVATGSGAFRLETGKATAEGSVWAPAAHQRRPSRRPRGSPRREGRRGRGRGRIGSHPPRTGPGLARRGGGRDGNRSRAPRPRPPRFT